METAVLPAQDHLAQQRYHQSFGGMSGMFYSHEYLPRTRRKPRAVAPVLSSSSAEFSKSSSQGNGIVNSFSRVVPSSAKAFGVFSDVSFHSSQKMSSANEKKIFIPHKLDYRAPGPTHKAAAMAPPKQVVVRSLVTTPKGHFVQCPDGRLVPFRILRQSSDGVMVKDLKNGLEGSRDWQDSNGAETLEERMMAGRKIADKMVIERREAFDKNGAKKLNVITILRRPQSLGAVATAVEKVKEAGVVRSVKKANDPATKNDITRDGLYDTCHPRGPSRGASNAIVVPTSESIVKLQKENAQAEIIFQDRKDDVPLGARSLDDGVISGISVKVRPVSPISGKKKVGFKTTTARAGARVVGSESWNNMMKEKIVVTLNVNDTGLPSAGKTQPITVLTESTASQANPGIQLEGQTCAPCSSAESLSTFLSGSASKGSDCELFEDSKCSVVQRIGETRDGSTLIPSSSSQGDLSVGLRDVAPSTPPLRTERWAGPAYSNSPPPSTLPFPKFPMQRLRSVLTELNVGVATSESQGSELVRSSSAPTSPMRGYVGYFTASTTVASCVDTSSATKDLRRILNLDMAFSTDGDGNKSEEEFEKDTATQGLKKILQLS